MPRSPSFRNLTRALLTAPVRRPRRRVDLERLEDRHNPAPVPAVAGMPAELQPLIGDAAALNLTFVNNVAPGAGNTGFAPFIELAVDSSGVDGAAGAPLDGIGTPVVRAAGILLSPIGSVTLTPGQTTYVNPITGETRTLSAVYGAGRFGTNDTLYFYNLPFGSFTGGQNTAVSVELPTSSLADLNATLPVSVVPGFRDDEASLNGPRFYGPAQNTNVVPQLYKLTKTYLGPESETATGPNYVRRYRLEVDIATGQPVTNLTVTDALADSMQLVGRNATVVAGNPNVAAFLGAGLPNVFSGANLTATGGANTGATTPTAPGGTVTYAFGATTGVAGADAALEFNFYVPRDRDPAGAPVAPDPNSPTVAQGTDSTTATNTTNSTLNWDPLDPRDPVQNNVPPSAPLSTLQHTLEQHALAIQKTATVVDRATGAAVAPGDPIRPGQALIRYTLNFQVSDYHAVNDVFVRDVFGDGQRLFIGTVGGQSTFPTLAVNNAFLTGSPGTRASTAAGAFTGPGVIDYQRRFTTGNAASDPTTIPANGPANAVFNNLAADVQPDSPTSDAGSTYLEFDISGELRTRLGATAGRLVGAEILNTGVGPENDNHPQTNPPPGAVTGTIVFFVEVTEEFSDEFRTANGGSGDPTVDQGDVLGNAVNDPRTALRDGIFGDELSAATINAADPTVIGRASDDSGTGVAIPYGVQAKQLVAINGQGVPAQTFVNPPYAVQPEDRVTYLLTYTLPVSRFEDLRLLDYPPLPVINLGLAPNNAPTFTRNPAAYGFTAGEVGVFVNGTTPGGLTAPGYASDTFFSTFAPGNGTALNPALSIDTDANQLAIDFGDFDDVQDRFTTLSLLVTFSVRNDPFAADLFLTNQLRITEGSTNAGDVSVEDLRRFELVRPQLNIYKGIVGTQRSGAAATGSRFPAAAEPPADGDAVTFTGPGTALAFTNDLNTVAEAVAIGNASTAALDAGDRVRFALVAQNAGKGDAFNVRIRDVLPTGYVIPGTFTGALFRGDGTALVEGTDYTLVSYNATTGEFVVELADNYSAGNVGGASEDARSGGLSRGTRVDQAAGNVAITNGSNAVVVLFDLTLADTVAPGQALTNTATIPQYSNSESGGNLTDPGVVPGATTPTDTATVTVPVPLAKSIVSTSEAHTSEAGTGTNASPRLLAVGEIVRYRLVVDLAEGAATNFQVRDNLPNGLVFLNDGTARVLFVSTGGTGITSSTISDPAAFAAGAAPATPTFALPAGAISGGPFTQGVDPIFSLGTLTNADRDADSEYVVIEFNALAGNHPDPNSNDAGDPRDNTFTARVNGADVNTSGNVRVTVVEPSITNLAKSASPGTADAGDTITFTVTFSNANGASNTTAFDLNVTDVVPAAYTTVTAGTVTAPTAVNPVLTVTGNTVTFTADSLPVGGSVTFTYTAILANIVGPGTYTNTANITYTSLPGANGTTVNATGSANTGTPGSDTGERTGAGNQNDYADSDPADVVVNGNLGKVLAGTNLAQTGGSSVAVGETVTYTLTVTIPEGTTPSITVVDRLPAGLRYVANSGVVDATGLNGTLGTLTISGGAAAGDDVTFAFGSSSAVPDNDPTNNSFTISLQAVVVSAAGNEGVLPGQTGLLNDATVQFGGGAVVTSPPVTVTVVEPQLAVDKTVVNLDTSVDAGALINYQVVIRHTANSTGPAFDLVIGDLLAGIGMDLEVGTVAVASAPVYATTAITSGNTPGATAVGLTASELRLGDTITITYSARPRGAGSLAAPIPATGSTVTNTVTVDYDTWPGANPDERAEPRISDTAQITINTYSIAGNTFSDANNDGVLNGADVRITGQNVTYVLSGTDHQGNPVTAAQTTATGTYSFTGLRPGLYTVTQQTQPAGFLDGRDTPGTPFGGTGTAANAARAPRDADAITTITIPLNAAQDGTANAGVSYDFGELAPATLGDFVWHDLNGNGLQDGGEPGLNGVTVTLTGTDDSGQPVSRTTTTGNNPVGGAPGYYQFDNLRPSTAYTVTFGTLAGYEYTARDATTAPGFTDALDSDGDPETGAAAPVAVVAGASIQTIDQGLYVPVTLGNRVFYDRDGNGVQLGDGTQPGDELGIPGVAITVVWHGPDGVIGGTDNQTFNAVTGANGIWTVPDLPPGSYTVTATPPAGAGFDLFTDSLDDTILNPVNPVVVTTTSGNDRLDVDFGYRGVGAVGDRVFLDVNANGAFDAGEGLANVTVTLTGDLNGDGTPDTLTTTTDADGFYQFTNLRVTAVGVPYTVTIDTADLPRDGAGNPITNTVDPDTANPGNSTSAVTLTTAAPSNQLQDFGYRGPGQIGDTVFLDVNGNNAPDLGEGITGVLVRLTGDVDADGTAETFFATTNASGIYDFSNLPVFNPNGALINWTVTVDPNGTTLPAGVTNTVDPDTANPGNGTSALTLNPADPINLLQDFGYRGVGSIGDRVFLDVNANGAFDVGEGLNVITVTLTADVNGDGVNETFTTTTDADGFYLFGGLPVFRSDTVTPVPYTVAVDTATLPTGLTNTVDPDTAAPGNSTSALTLSAAVPNNLAQDFGYRGAGSLGDRVWIDTNANGLQDALALEPGLPGVELTLTWSINATFGDADDVTSTVLTNALGNYTFGGLPLDQGRFRVEVTPATLPGNNTQTYDLDGLGSANSAGGAATPVLLTTAAPTRTDVDFGYVGSASLGDRVYFDQDRDGFQDASEPGIPGATVRLTWGGPDNDLSTPLDNVVFTTTTGANGAYLFPGLLVYGLADDYRVEVTALPIAGLTLTDSLADGADGGVPSPVNPVDVEVRGAEGDPLNDRRDVDFGYDGAGSLAGTVYRDDNNTGVQDAGEPGIAGVVLTLTGTDPFGNPVLNPATGLPYTATTDANGDYAFTTVIPGVYRITEAQPAAYGDGTDAAGSLGGNTGNDVLSGIPVGPNDAGVEYNFGELPTSVSGTVFRDDDRDGTPDAGEPRLPGVRVELRNPADDSLISFTLTDATGNYSFTQLPAGDYRLVEIQPAGYADGPVGPATVRNVTVPTTGLTDQNFAEVLGSLSGRVYIDENNSGTREASEPGIGGVPVTLTGTDFAGNPVNVTVFTDTLGRYTFPNLFPANAGGYAVNEGATPPFTDRASNVGTGFATAGTNPTANQFTGLNLTAGQNGVDYDFGEVRPANAFIRGSVFRDDGRDGARQPSDPPVPNVEIRLLNAAGNVIATTQTDASGNYVFPNLTPGVNYTIVETQPGNYGDGPVGPARQIAVPNLPPTGSTGNDFPEVFGSLGGTVFFDQNRDGTRQPGEPGIGGVTVNLTGTDAIGNAVTRTTTTAPDGTYFFPLLPAGTYAVTETQPAGYADGGDAVGSAGGTGGNDATTAVPLGGGVNAVGYDFGEVGVPVSGTVFHDRDRDGALDPGEPPIPGVTVRLIDPTGTVVGTTTTDANGNYVFPNVPPGNYTLVETQPAGYGDPLAGPFAPNTRPITVAGAAVTNQNFGDTLSTLAGTVYIDIDLSNDLTTGEPGLGGVQIRLDSAGPDRVFGTGDDVVGFRTTNTDADGNYLFADLPTGVYRVVEPTQPTGFDDGAETEGTAGGDTATNERITDIPLAAGTDITGYNFGEVANFGAGLSFLAGTVYLDSNGNGQQDGNEPGLEGVTVTLTGPGGPVVIQTDAGGNYVFGGLTPGLTYTVTESQPAAYGTGPEVPGNVITIPELPADGSTGNNFGETPGTISGTVYYDANTDGALDAGDVRLPGVTVTLLDGAGNPVNDPTTGQPYVATTAADGTYSFTNLPAGDYRVIETQPTDYNQGTNTPGTGGVLNGTDRIDVTLPAGGASPANDFGELGAPVSGRVFLDVNRNGARDPEDTAGLGNVTITLLDGNGTVVRTTTTNPDGTYEFLNLPPGNYTLVQTQPNTVASTSTNVLPVVLTAAGVVNQDFGETRGTLAGTVYADTNNNGIREAGENPISGVTVTLTGTDADGNAVTRTTTTDAAGNYLFTDLPAGTYQVVETQPLAYDDGIDTVGSASGDVVAPDTIRNIPLAAGADLTRYDFGEVTSSLAGFVYTDFDLNAVRTLTGPMAETGNHVAGTNTPGGIGGITITLTGTDRDGRPVTRTTTTAADGSYSFVGLGAGIYSLAETQPPLPTALGNGFYDGAETEGSVGGTVVLPGPNFTADANKNQIRAISLPTATAGVNYNFGELPPADPFGFVYLDANRNGVRDPGELGIANSSITLSGTAFAGTPFARPLVVADVPGGLTRLTDADGRYEFVPIPPGLYTLTQDRQPAGYADGLESDGDPNGPPATIGVEVISGIALAPFPIRGPFNFGELALPAAPGNLIPIDFFPADPVDVSKRSFLTTTPDAVVPPGFATAPNFAAFNPGARASAFAAVAEGAGGTGIVRVFDFAGGVERFRFRPYGEFAGGARVATGDVTGDGIPDVITVPGVGGGPVVKVFDGNTGAEVRSFAAFEAEFRGGLRVAVADLNGDFVADIVVTPDVGGGPVVRAFDGRTGAMIANFFALDETFRGGLRVAAADVNRDGVADLVVTAGEGGGPRVAVYDGATLTTGNPTRLAGDFFGFAPELRSGFWISAADVDGDGFADIVMGAGAGGAPRVVVYSGQVLAAGGGAREVASFFAGEPADRGGARVMAADLDGDGRAEVMTGTGGESWPLAYVFAPLTGERRDAFYATAAPFRGGVEVG